MAAIGGRAVAFYPTLGTPQAVNQSTWQTLAGTIMSAIPGGGAIAGFAPGPGFNFYLDVVCASGENPVIRGIFDDVRITDGTSVATAVANCLVALGDPAVIAAVEAAGFSDGGVGTPTVQFEPWGDSYIPGP